MVLASLGVLVGIGSALALNSIMQRMLFGVSATEPFAYLAVSALLISIAALAAYVPSRRATRISPSVALRCE
jgi:ABC-type antimicrobial peptide transport system permease subunit